MGHGHILMAILWLLIIGLGILLLQALFPKTADGSADSAQKPTDKPPWSATQILSRRYARGEISEEQYRNMRRDLEN